MFRGGGARSREPGGPDPVCICSANAVRVVVGEVDTDLQRESDDETERDDREWKCVPRVDVVEKELQDGNAPAQQHRRDPETQSRGSRGGNPVPELRGANRRLSLCAVRNNFQSSGSTASVTGRTLLFRATSCHVLIL
ncbi:unannotated protein [freshwater metagenome]|uniref:Unannotated protein n=1 Tax=freshwater metagenome TaxID=449393 RepID=A0A6J6FIU6_9ZZZZ